MANVIFYQAAHMDQNSVWSGSVYEATSSDIILSDGYHGGIYYGLGFTYFSGAVVGGTLTGYDAATNVNISSGTYDVAYSVRGLNVPAATAYNYIQSGNNVGLENIALSGSDSITGSQFDDVIFGFDGNDYLYGNGGSDLIRGGGVVTII